MRRLLPLAMLLGCPFPKGKPDVVTDTFAQASGDVVDELWVVDTSESMQTMDARLAEAWPDIVDGLGAVDYHVGLATMDAADAGALRAWVDADTPEAADVLAAATPTDGSGSDLERGLESAVDALDQPANEGFFRDGAVLELVFFSDEDDCSDWGALGEGATGEDCYDRADELAPVGDVVTELLAHGDVVANGIVGPAEGCGDATPGTRFLDAIERIGGVAASICEEEIQDFGTITAARQSRFQLSYAAVEATIEVEVDGDAVEPDEERGWTYDADYAQIVFHGVSVPAAGAEIVVTYSPA